MVHRRKGVGDAGGGVRKLLVAIRNLKTRTVLRAMNI